MRHGERGGVVGRSQIRRRTLAAALASALALGMVGCTSADGDGEGPDDPTADIVHWPLTGADVSDEEADRPALSVKIENSSEARPQAGLEDADLVWEEMVEGGTTRFNVTYHSVIPDEVGPVRSVRPMDAAIAGPIGGILAFSGGQDPYIERASEVGLQVLSNDAGDEGFYRTDDRAAPHNVYADGQALLDQADDDRTPPPTDLFQFAESADAATATTQGETAESVVLDFPASTPSWTWTDEADVGRGVDGGAWRRSEGGTSQESADGDPVLASNVVVLRVRVEMTSAVDASGSHVPETILEGEGDGVVFSGGRAVEISWSKGGDSDPLQLTYDGEPVVLAPGITWVELLPISEAELTY